MTKPKLVNGNYTQRANPRDVMADALEQARKLRTDPLERPHVAAIAPQLISPALWVEYTSDPSVNRTFSQLVEQAVADATILPKVGNEAVQAALEAWWRRERMPLRISPAFKAFLISGEVWNYLPRRTDGRIPLRELTPWQVKSITGHAWHDWETAEYGQPDGQTLTLNPANTIFFAHDALFGNMRGVSPLVTIAFAARRYRRFLDGRERVNALAGIVTGEMNFENVHDAAAVLGWKFDEEGNPIPETVTLPEEGTVAVTIGNSRFELKSPNVAGGAADPDGQRFFLRVIEGGRLPEYTSGNGANVNVATAQVQYPFAVRFILALRDEFEAAMSDTIRLVLQRMTEAGFIPRQWQATREDGSTLTETPATADVTWAFPEIRELDFKSFFDSVMTLVDKSLLEDERAMELLGYDPERDMPDPEERERRRQQRALQPQPAQPANRGGDDDDEEGEAARLEGIRQAVRAGIKAGLTDPDE